MAVDRGGRRVVGLRVVNWRSISELSVELAPVTVLVGKNSVGKSSLAYAAYFLAKLPQWRDLNALLQMLYGAGLDGVARRSGDDKANYPVVVEADGCRFVAESPAEFKTPDCSPFRDGYLLPSQRIGFSKLSLFLSNLVRRLSAQSSMQLAFTLLSGMSEILKSLPLAPPMPLFLSDYASLFRGRGLVDEGTFGGSGRLMIEGGVVLDLMNFKYVDPYTRLGLSADRAPDGFVDAALIQQTVEKALERSLIVIEEPEIHKDPLFLVDLAKQIARSAVERGLTIVMTTHSDLVVQAIAKAVEERMIGPADVAIYYLERSSESPWTKATRLNVYEDGTVDQIPGAEEVVAALF